MTTTTKRIGLALGAALVAIGVATGVRASAQNTNPDQGTFRGQRMGPPHGPMGPGGPMGLGPEAAIRMLRMLGPRLNLTEAQRDQLKSIVESHRDEWQALGERARAAHQAVRSAVMADQIDESVIRAKVTEAATVDADVAVAAARARAEAYQVLTPDQQAQLKSLQSELNAGRRPPFGRGRGRQ